MVLNTDTIDNKERFIPWHKQTFRFVNPQLRQMKVKTSQDNYFNFKGKIGPVRVPKNFTINSNFALKMENIG